MEYFIFNGIDSRDFGLEIVNRTPNLTQTLSPTKRTTTEVINGIDGSKVFQQDYDMRTIELRGYVRDNSNSNLRIIMSWLGVKYPKDLILSYEPYKVYSATFENQIDFRNYVDKGIFDITFRCYSPFAKSKFTTQDITSGIEYDSGYYYDSGLIYVDGSYPNYVYNSITSTTDLNIYNGSNVDGALPNIILIGSASSVKIEHFSDNARTDKIAEANYGSFSGVLEIDSILQNTFLDGTVDNSTFEGDYFELIGKRNWNPQVYGSLEDFTSNTVTLNDYAVGSDDYYNGMLLLISRGETVQGYTITDYVGATRTATIGGTLDLTSGARYKYSIYDNELNGYNFFRISGTSLNLSQVEFFFNYVYL